MDRLRTGIGRRTVGITLALLIEGLLLLALLSLGPEEQAGKKEERVTAVNLEADDASEEAPEPNSPEPKQQATPEPSPQQAPPQEPLSPSRVELPPQSAEPAAVPIPPAIIPAPLAPSPTAAVPRTVTTQASPARRPYGPPDTGGSPASHDSEPVGSAPNGEPLYAAAWYREPTRDQLRGYLSTARGPGWGLIACRTAPDYRVEDCVALDEYPEGSQINRAVLAAAWEFRVRPPRLGGRPLVGAWVRIRIDYGFERP